MNNVEISNNKRIAKNTLFLFFRMLLIMLVSLYTTRAVLAILGAEDYGIYNVVGGVVTALAFLTNTMVSSSQRFFAFYIGIGDKKKLKEYFNTTSLCYLIVGICVVFIAETIGLWFVINKLTIPINRIDAALWVYQCTICSFIVKLFVIPLQSMIIAQEKMNIYAYVSIIEAFLQLAIVYLLNILHQDYLILYSVLQLITVIITTIWYIVYCRSNFEETHFYFFFNLRQFKELIGYSAWNLIGALSTVIRSQGINILLNVFFNPVVSTARAIAYQVNTAINSLSTNFFSAVRPQITKQYASKQTDKMLDLVFRSSRFCYYILFIMALPILIETSFVLELWLKDVPKYTISFTQLVIVNALIDSIGHPLITAIQATGRIKYYQLSTAGILILNLPVSYCFLKLGYPPQITMIISIFISLIAQLLRMIFMKNLLHMSLRQFNKQVNGPILLATLTAVVIPMGVHVFWSNSFVVSIVNIVASIILSILTVFLFGITKTERFFVTTFVNNKLGIGA